MSAVIQESTQVEPVRQPPTVMADIGAQREIAEVQAQMVIAKKFPRDVRDAMDRLLMTCTRAGLAEAALYEYARGGTAISGPSIRLAEAIAQCWGNISFGIRELEQRQGESTVEAFAVDLETNTRQVKVFQVPHIRVTRTSRTTLTDPRDIYEMVANQGARRLRACILGIVPGDVIEAAVAQCETTLKTKAEVTPERLASLLAKFAEFGVTQAQIEARIQRHLDAMTPALMVQLGKIYTSLKDGMSHAADWFEAAGGAPASTAEAAKDALRGKKAKAALPIADENAQPPEAAR